MPQSLGSRWAEVLLIVMVFFIFGGDLAPHVNEPHYLCRLKHFWNPDWCQGDLFLESTDAHVVFVWLFGWLTHWLSLAATAWVGRILEWCLLAWAWRRLSWRLVPVPLGSVLSAALFVALTALANLAGEWVVGGFEAKCFAYFFVLLALREMVDRRWNRVWLMLGAASALHVLVGGWSVVVCGGIWLLEERNAASLRAMLPGLVGGGLLALFGVVPALALNWHEPPDVVAEANRIYVFFRLPHHLAPLTLPREEIVRRLVPHLLMLCALYALGRAAKRMFASMQGAFDMDARGLTEIGRFAWGAAILAGVGLTIELALWNEPTRAAALLRFYWFRMTDVAAPLAVALLTVALISTGLAERRSWAVWGLAAALALCGWQAVLVSRPRLDLRVPRADYQMRDPVAWADACQWVADHTPPDALFLTPRLAQSFKWRTGRAEVATRKDVPQDARSIVQWHDRMNNIHYATSDEPGEPVRSLGHLGTTRIRELADRYGFDYVVTDHRHPLELRVAYWNAGYVVYAL